MEEYYEVAASVISILHRNQEPGDLNLSKISTVDDDNLLHRLQ